MYENNNRKENKRMERTSLVKVVIQTWKDFWHTSTITGINQSAISHSGLRKLIWAALFLFFAILTFTEILKLMDLRNTTTTTINFKNNATLTFPAVTICNHNRIMCSLLKQQMTDCGSIKPTSTNDTYCIAIKAMAKLSKCTPDASPSTRSKRQISVEPKEMGSGPPGSCATCSIPADITNDENFVMAYMSLNSSSRYELGHDFNDFVKACTYQGRDCLDMSFFLLYQNPTYGNCFTFNSLNNDKDKLAGQRRSSQTGADYGLKLVLNINQGEYLKGAMTKSGGVRVTVHNPKTLPLPVEFGMDTMPAQTTGFAMQMVHYTRLEEPFDTNCTAAWSHTPYTQFVETSKWNYTINKCRRLCLQTIVMQECSCFHPLYMENDKDRNGLKPCNISSGTTNEGCISDIVTELDRGERVCECNAECDQVDFAIVTSSATWPSETYKEEAKKTYFGMENNKENMPQVTTAQLTTAQPTSAQAQATASQSTSTGLNDSVFNLATMQEATTSNNAAGGDSRPEITENLLHVNVYYSSLNVINYETAENYPSSVFWSTLGGTTGLYLGCSFCVLFEFVELIVDFVMNLLFSCMGRKIGRENLP